MLRRALLFAAVVSSAACGSESGNRPPIAHAGDDVLSFVGDAVPLDGGESTDPDGDDLELLWTVLSAPPGSALAAGSVLAGTGTQASLVADAPGAFVIALDATDGDDTHRDVLTVTARRALEVVATSPVDGAIGVSGAAPVVLLFSAPIRRWEIAGAATVEALAAPGVAVPGVLGSDDGDTVVLFTPIAPWGDGVDYRVVVDTTLLALDGAPMREPFELVFTGSASDTTPPAVVAATPGGSGVPASSSVSILFSEPVDPLTVGSAFSLAPTSAVDVALSAGNTRATFTPVAMPGTPQPLAADTDYVATLADTLTDPTGNALDGDGDQVAGGAYALSFRTAAGPDATAPRVVAVSPLPGASDASVKGPVTVLFSEPVDPATVTAASLVVSSDGAAATGSLVFELGYTVASFVPAPNLATGARYDLRVESSIADLAGNAVETFASSFRTGSAPAPSVYSADPASGRRAETFPVTVYGEDFVPGAEAFVLGGGAIVDSTTFIASDELSLSVTLSPGAPLGPHAIRVVNPDGQEGTGLGLLSVLRAIPEIDALDPAVGSRGDPTLVDVEITGNYFDCSGAPALVPSVSFGDAGITVANVDCGGSTSGNATSLFADVTLTGAATVGAKSVSVLNPGDSASGSAAGAFTVRLERPVLTSVTGTVEQGDSGVTVTLVGDFFQETPLVTPEAGSGISVTSVSWDSATQLTVGLTVPYATAAGDYDLTVLNPDLQSVTAVNVLTVDFAPPPSITTVSPSFGERGTMDLTLTLTGSGFQPGTMGTTVQILDATGTTQDPDIVVDSVTVDSETQLTVVLDIPLAATAGFREIRVTNPVGMMGNTSFTTTTDAFNVTNVLPAITSVVPNSGQQGATVNPLTINGVNFSGSTVTVGSMACTSPTVTATQITCTLAIPAGETVGLKNVTVTNADGGQDVEANAFTVTSTGGGPTVSAIDTRGVNFVKGRTVSVEIVGAGFTSGATVTVSGPASDVVESATTFRSSSRLQVNLTVGCGDFELGFRDLTVTNPDGLSGALPNAVFLRDGLVLNEVITQKRSDEEEVEVFNGRGTGCDGVNVDLTGYRVESLEATARFVFEFGVADANTNESYGGSATRTNFPAGSFVTLTKFDNSTMANDVYLILVSPSGRIIDDVEIGEDPEFDGTDGAPVGNTTNDGGNTNTNDESVARCPNGRDTDNDVNDWYQDDTSGVLMARTFRASNSAECPQCSDGVNNDPGANGWTDWPLDAGCSGPNDNSESGGATTTQCNDGIDNDGAGGTDAADVDCFSASDNNESQ